MKAIHALIAATMKSSVPQKTMGLVHLRASQINGCSSRIDSGTKSARKEGESEDRLYALYARRTSPRFNDAERGAIALAEAVTRLADQEDPVPDAVWEQAAKHYNETERILAV